MSPSSSDAADASAVRPYGLVGLIVSILIIFIMASVLLVLIAGGVLGVFAALDGWKDALQRVVDLLPSSDASGDAVDRINIVAGATAYVVVAGSILLVARFRGGSNWTDLVAWTSWNMMGGLRLILTLLAATLVYSLVASSLIEHFYPQAKEWVPTPTGTFWIVGFIALATLFAPITEELLFRGWIYTSLRAVIGMRFGIALSAVLFALAHWESTHLYALAVFPVGLALGYVRERTGSVAASITFHALYNGVTAVLLFLTK